MTTEFRGVKQGRIMGAYLGPRTQEIEPWEVAAEVEGTPAAAPAPASDEGTVIDSDVDAAPPEATTKEPSLPAEGGGAGSDGTVVPGGI
jgi:hypothetical protein